MVETDEAIAKTIAGLKELVSQLQSGQLKYLFARTGDPEWSAGAEPMIRHYGHILSLLEPIRLERAELRKARRKRRLARKSAGQSRRTKSP